MKPLLIASLIASGLFVSGCKVPGMDQEQGPEPAPAAPVSAPPMAVPAPQPQLAPAAAQTDNPMMPQGVAALPQQPGAPVSVEPVPVGPGPNQAMPAPQAVTPQPAPSPMPQPVAVKPQPSAPALLPTPQVRNGHDQFELCEADSWQKAIQSCKEGQLVTIIPTKIAGGDQFQLTSSAAICDFTQQIISRTGGVVCVFTRKRYDFVMAEQSKAEDERKLKEAREKEDKANEKAAKKAAQMAAEAAAAANAQVKPKTPKVIDPNTGEPVAVRPRHRPIEADQNPFGPRE